MRALIILILFAACCIGAAYGAQPTDQQAAQIEALQAELQATRMQRDEAANKMAALVAQANVVIAQLQRRIAELEAKPAAPGSK